MKYHLAPDAIRTPTFRTVVLTGKGPTPAGIFLCSVPQAGKEHRERSTGKKGGVPGMAKKKGRGPDRWELLRDPRRSRRKRSDIAQKERQLVPRQREENVGGPVWVVRLHRVGAKKVLKRTQTQEMSNRAKTGEGERCKRKKLRVRPPGKKSRPKRRGQTGTLEKRQNSR